MCSELNARADSHKCLSERTLSNISSSVSQVPGLPHHSGSVRHNAAIKTGIMIADAAANDRTTSPKSASMSSPSHMAAAESTESDSIKSPCHSPRSPASNTPSTDSRRKQSITGTAERQHPKGRSNKPAGSHRARRRPSPKSYRHHRSPKSSRRQVVDHSFGRKGHTAAGRKHSRSPSKLKEAPAKHKWHGTSAHQSPTTGGSPSSAVRSRAVTSISQSPARQDRSADKNNDSDRPKKRGTRSGRRSRLKRLLKRHHRSLSKLRSPHATDRTPIAKGIMETTLTARQHQAEAGEHEPLQPQGIFGRAATD